VFIQKNIFIFFLNNSIAKRDDGSKVFRNQKQEELLSYTLQERQNRSGNTAQVTSDMADECEGGEMSGARRSGGGGDGGLEISG
jgi:hypothetical protein